MPSKFRGAANRWPFHPARRQCDGFRVSRNSVLVALKLSDNGLGRGLPEQRGLEIEACTSSRPLRPVELHESDIARDFESILAQPSLDVLVHVTDHDVGSMAPEP